MCDVVRGSEGVVGRDSTHLLPVQALWELQPKDDALVLSVQNEGRLCTGVLAPDLAPACPLEVSISLDR